MKRILALLVLFAGWLPLHASAVCFTVLMGHRIVYRDLTSPIDLSLPISDTLPNKYPGGQLIINPESDHCTLITPVTAVDLRAPAEASAPMASAEPAKPAPAPTGGAGTPAAKPAQGPAAEGSKPR